MIIIDGRNNPEMMFVDKLSNQIGKGEEIVEIRNERIECDSIMFFILILCFEYNLSHNAILLLNIFSLDKNKNKGHLLGVFCGTYNKSFASASRTFKELVVKKIFITNQARGGNVMLNPELGIDFNEIAKKHFIVIDVNPEQTINRINLYNQQNYDYNF